MARRPPPRAQSTGLPPAFLAIAVILVAAAAVLLIVSQMQPPQEEEQQEEQVDPFADVPDEIPPGGVRDPFGGGGGGDDETAGTGGKDPFADLASPKEEQLWKDARELGDAGMDLVEAAGKAKEAGDLAKFKELGAEAKEKLEKALDVTRDWVHALEEQYGARNPEVKSIIRTRSIWQGRLVALKKTVGF